MEAGFTKADSANLPIVDTLMVANYFASNSNFIASEFRNVKTIASSRSYYGDDAIGHVQLRRDSNKCILKSKVCPEHKVRTKPYAATMVVDENQGQIISVVCHDCAASQGGCKHAVAFLMWAHRRSEEKSSTSTTCYWKKSKLAQVGTTLKCISSKDLTKAVPVAKGTITYSQHFLISNYLEGARNRKLNSCQLLKHDSYFEINDCRKLSLHSLIIEHADKDCDVFLNNISYLFSEANVKKVEKDTQGQYKSFMWHELRYGRITASNAFNVIRCQTFDGSLIATIMGGVIPDTIAMKRGRNLEEEVKKVVSKNLAKNIEPCGLVISSKYPYIAATPDGICDGTIIIEVKCPSTEKNQENYIKNNKLTEKCMTQVQLQMFVKNLKKCYFCMASWDFEKSHIVHLIVIDYDEEYTKGVIQQLTSFWKTNIYPILYKSTK